MIKQLSFPNARIGYKNFSGIEGQYNKAGDRNFVIFIDTERAEKLRSEGWNVKYPKPNDNIAPEDDERKPYLPIEIGMTIPPSIQMLTHTMNPDGDEDITSEKLLPENFGAVDFMEYSSLDIIVRPYEWQVNGNSGVKAYLKSMYINLEVDEFQAQYGINPAAAYR